MLCGYAEKTGRGRASSEGGGVVKRKERRLSSFDANTNGDARRPMTRLACVQRRLPRGLEARAKTKRKHSENEEYWPHQATSVAREMVVT